MAKQSPKTKSQATSSRKPQTGQEQTAGPKTLDRIVHIFTRFERFAWDIGGVLFLALALMTLLGLLMPSLAGGILAWWVDVLLGWFGWGSVWMVVLVGLISLWMLRRRTAGPPPKGFWGRVVLLEVAAFASLALLAVIGDISFARAEAGLDGGGIGWGLAELLRLGLTPIGLAGKTVMALIMGVMVAISLVAGLGLLRPLAAWARKTTRSHHQTPGEYTEPNPVVSEAPLPGVDVSPALAKGSRTKRPALPPQFRKNFRVQSQEGDTSASSQERGDDLPPLDILVSERSTRPDERNINLTAGLIEKTLSEFGIPAKVVGFRVGPTVIQYAVEPGYVEKDKLDAEGEDVPANRQKVRVAQISSLGRDLALALAAERLRIEAPVPGRPYVGIEVPNSRSIVVRLRPILEADIFYKVDSPLAVALGRDVSGQPVVADLGRMPHLLVAGTTGSGKSVCIAALTLCLVMNNTPDELRLVMVDPKMVELVRFNGLPHLMGKVETDMERILAVLRWVVVEMDRRYKLLETSRSRNIDTFNRKMRHRKNGEVLPRIVVMIDELADLMMTAPDQTEHSLVRLAQMARATGIHLVVATQRPSTDVVTGLIKANFPARLSFAVASMIDSRVILDTGGAESLLGRGDMLFLPPEAAGPVRVQGVMVSDQEVERLITFWQNKIPAPAEAEQAPWDELMAQEATLADRDDLVEKAIELVCQEQRASASMLQRRLRIGYPRAARLIDELEDLGVIGPPVSGGRERDVLIDSEESLN